MVNFSHYIQIYREIDQKTSILNTFFSSALNINTDLSNPKGEH
jgi:hypothetical protein